MARALELARSTPYSTSPNPTVGAVIVGPGGEIIAEGATEPPPGLHAEAVALKKAGERARGATLYVTLEPCSHQGRTPPCTQAIISAGVAEVHYAVADPDPKAAGGHKALETAGVRVVRGEREEEARRANEAFFKHRTAGLPFVIAKFAMSLDGRTAAASGDSRWISGPQARAWAHRLRARADAILAGSSTIVIDDPQLTARPDGRPALRQPLRVVVDSRGRTPPMARVFTGPGRTLVATLQTSPASWRAAIQAQGAEVLAFGREGDRVDLTALLQELGRRDILTLLVEGGGGVLGGFFDRGLVDKLHAVIAPIIIGAADAPAPVAGRGAYRMANALHLGEVTVERLGEDIVVTAYPEYPERAA
jgi:diaminohydroxyphosphoribosylaminopyrimidine deaminase/5-amino-6-(5-phosphoribosylamino)uracil reductase